MKVWDGKSGLLDPEDIALIKEVVRMLPKTPVVVMDLGAGSGTSALAVFTARSKNIHVISVDISDTAIANTNINMVQYGFIDKWSGIINRADRVPETFDLDFGIDLLMDDCSHDYASQQDNLNAWFPYLKPGTKLWIHDANDSDSKYPGVRRAIEEFISQGVLKTLKVGGLSWVGEFIGNGLA